MNGVEVAERTCLGALLLEPQQIPVVSAWLGREDFLHPKSVITYRLLLDLSSDEGPVGPTDLLEVALADEDARRNNVAGPYIHELIASPGGAGRAVLYARIVLEESVKRRLAEHAIELARRARLTEQAPESVPGLAESINYTYGMVHAMEGRLGWADAEYLKQPGGIVAPDDPPPTYVPNRSELEREVIRALEDNPEAVMRLRRWLKADDFADPRLAGTYRSMVELARRGIPIDQTTTQWNRRDEFAAADLVPAHVVATTPRYTYFEAVRLGGQLLGKSVATRTEAAAESILQMGQNPHPTTKQRLHTAMHQLDRRRLDTARWHEAQVGPY